MKLPFHLFLMHYMPRIRKTDLSMDDIMRTNAIDLIPEFLVAERNRLKQMPLYELVEELYRRLDLKELSEQEAYHYAFLDTVQTYLRDRILQIANIFQKLSKKDFPYLREFRIRNY